MTQPCPKCGLQFNCICPILPKLNSEVTLMLLMHPNEAARDTNTGKLLPQCQLNVQQVIWDRKAPSQALLTALNDPNWLPVLLFPSEESLTLSQIEKQTAEQNKSPLFIILDATWQEARKMINKSRWLEGITMMTLSVESDSQYQLRRNQQQGNLCTFEVAAELLGQLGEKHNQKLMQDFWPHYLACFQAEKSGHQLKQK